MFGFFVEGEFSAFEGGQPDGFECSDGKGEGVVEVTISGVIENLSHDFDRLGGRDFGTGEDGFETDAGVFVGGGLGEEFEWFFELRVPAADEAGPDGAEAWVVRVDHGFDQFRPW